MDCWAWRGMSNQLMEKWPNFFIVGAAKSGSTSLYEYLNQTPGIYMSPVKEPHFFVSKEFASRFDWVTMNKKKYLTLFKNASNEIAIGEASPSYLRDPQAANLIHNTVPNAKIIIILRDPVERAFSAYLMWGLGIAAKHSFKKVIKEELDSRGRTILEPSFYYDNVKRYIDIFGREQVKVIIFEEFVKDTRMIAKDVLEFLQVNSEPPESIKEIYNSYKVPRKVLGNIALRNQIIRYVGKKILPHSMQNYLITNVLLTKGKKPKLSEEDRIFFDEIVRNDLKKLSELLGRSFPWHPCKNLNYN